MNQSASGPDKGRVCVIGGGVAGLATAVLLAADGWSVELLEKRSELGGRAGSWEIDGFRFDTGPSWYLMPEVFEHFFELAGTTVEDHLDLVGLDPGYRVFYENAEMLEVHAERERNLAVFNEVEPGAGEALEEYLESADEAYQVAVDHFLYTNFERPLALVDRSLWSRLPRLAKLLTSSLEDHVAKRFSEPRLRQILGYPAVFLGGSPDRVPALYHLMSRMDLGDGVRYPMGGFVELTRALESLARSYGVTLRTGAEAESIETQATNSAPDHSVPLGRIGRLDRIRSLGSAGIIGARRPRAQVTGVRYRDADGTSQLANADVVVGAADLRHIETKLLPATLRSYSPRWWRKRDPGPGAVLICLGVRGELPELAHHSLFFTEDWETNFGDLFGDRPKVPNPASSYVCRPSATDPSVAPAGHENLFVLIPIPADTSIGRGGIDGQGDKLVEQIADRAIDQIARWAGVPDLAERIVVRRTIGPADFEADYNAWSGGVLGPGHTLAQSAFFRANNQAKHVSGLLYAGGTTRPGIGLPMCLISAELVAKRLRGDRSVGPLSAPISPRAVD